MNIGNPEHERLRRTLRTQEKIRLAIVFGSVARGAARADSDLDIAVDLGRPMSAEEKQLFIAALAETSGRPVDLVDLRTVGEPLLGEILQDGIRLIGSSSDHGALLYRHLIEQADFLPYHNRILRERRQRWTGK